MGFPGFQSLPSSSRTECVIGEGNDLFLFYSFVTSEVSGASILKSEVEMMMWWGARSIYLRLSERDQDSAHQVWIRKQLTAKERNLFAKIFV